MSLLDTMRRKEKDLLTERHPMKDSDRGTRFAYLVGLAMGAVVDGTVHQKEREAVMERAFSLELPEEDGTRAIETAEKADDGTVSSVLESLTDPMHRELFLTDLRLMALSDGSVAPEEDELWNLFANMMKVGEDERKALSGFASAAMASDGKAALEALFNGIDNGMNSSVTMFKFFLPSMQERISISGQTVGSGEKLIISRPTMLEGPIIVTQGGELVIDGADILISQTAFGPIPENENSGILSAITIWGGEITLKNSNLNCNADSDLIKNTNSYRMLVIAQDNSLNISQTIFNGNNHIAGPEIVMAKDCSINNCSFIQCKFKGNGGGIFINCRSKINNCIFNKCLALNGGGIAIKDHLELFDCVISDCSAEESGGGISYSNIYGLYGISIQRCSFKGCKSKQGGGIASTEKSLPIFGIGIEASFFTECICSSITSAGAIDVNCITPEIQIKDTKFNKCQPKNIKCGCYNI